MDLPLKKIPGTRKNPGLLVMAGFQKSGKTTALAELEDNLMLDFEDGTEYMDAMKVSIRGLKDLSDCVAALRTSEHKYRRITVDTGTKMEEVALELAVINYRKMPIGRKWEGKTRELLNLPNGLGYGLLRNAFIDILNWLKPFCETLILVCHIKNTSFSKDGEELTMVDLNLTGQLKTLIAAEADAVGMFYRKGNKSILSFRGGESFLVGARPDHLKNMDFTIIESDGDKDLTIDWSGVFPN